MKKILLVEGDELFALDIKVKLEEAFVNVDILHCISASEARMVLGRFQPDIMLVEVILEDENSGIVLAKLAEEKRIPVIFLATTTRQDLFKKALKTRPFNYLQRPFSFSTLKNAIALVFSRTNKSLSREKKKVSVQSVLLKDNKNILKKVSLKDIFLLEAYGNYCHIHTLSYRYTHRMTLKNFDSLVGLDDFVRIQRNFVININYLESIDSNNKLVVVAGRKYPFSSRYKANMIKRLGAEGRDKDVSFI